MGVTRASRVILVAVDGNGNLIPVKADSLGNLTVTGAGVSSGTQVQLVDGTTISQKAAVSAAGEVKVTGAVTGTVALDTASLAALESIDLNAATLTTLTADNRTLTERMFARAPQAGYSIWLDTADATNIYIAEALTSKVGTDANFQGIRVQKDASGNPLGKVQIATAFAWNSRTTAAWS